MSRASTIICCWLCMGASTRRCMLACVRVERELKYKINIYKHTAQFDYKASKIITQPSTPTTHKHKLLAKC